MNAGRKRRRFLRAAAWLAVLPALAFAMPSRGQEEPESYAISSAQPGGVYLPLAEAICRLVEQGSTKQSVHCHALPSTGAVQNIARLAEGSVAFGLAQSDVGYEAAKGTGNFADSSPFVALRTVFAAHGEPLMILVPSESDIHALDQLPGHRIGIGQKGTGTREMFYSTMAAAGWSTGTFEAVFELSFERQVSALCAGEIDAAWIAIGQPNDYARRAIEECDARLVPVEGAIVDALLAATPSFRVLEIPGGLYSNHPASTASFGPVAMLMTRADVEDRAVEAIAGAVLDRIEFLREVSPAFRQLDARAMHPGEGNAPIHPGAARAFAARGIEPTD